MKQTEIVHSISSESAFSKQPFANLSAFFQNNSLAVDGINM